jgi:hypothetical protein
MMTILFILALREAPDGFAPPFNVNGGEAIFGFPHEHGRVRFRNGAIQELAS